MVKGLAASCVVHVVAIAAVLFVTTSRGAKKADVPAAAYDPPSHIVWLSAAGPGGGGGGGGKQEQTPPRAAQVKGADNVTMPSAPRSTDASETPKAPETLPDVPVQTLGASNLTSMGLIEAGAESLSHGSGRDGGVGAGSPAPRAR